MSWVRVAAAVVCASVVAVTGYAGMSVNAQEAAAGLDRDQKKMIVDCAAVYRWQGGPDDPSYQKLKGLYQTFSQTSPIVVDQTLSINRDAFERSVVNGKLTPAKMQGWLDSCADFSTLPAPPGPLRSTAFPETPKPESVTGLLDCLALARWQLGPFSYNLIAARDRYLAYARLTADGDEDAANAEIRRRVDNIDKALLAGAGSLTDLALAREACLRDFSVVITDTARTMSMEYDNEHPRAPDSESHLADNSAILNAPVSSGSGYASTPATPGYGGTDDGDHRLFTSGGVDVTNTTSSRECIEAMDTATHIMQPDLDGLTAAMERDRRYCTGDFECTYTANSAAVLACAAVNRGRGEIPSQCLKERTIVDNLREQVCPSSN